MISGLTLEEFDSLADANFAQEWSYRYTDGRRSLFPDISRWIRLVRFYHPRVMRDHWQDSLGNALDKLFQSRGLSVEIYNLCRPIIEVYASLLAGQKPLPFVIDVKSVDSRLRSELFRAESQEKVLVHEMMEQKIPLNFMDFCVSVVLFGIGYVMSWLDPTTKRLKTQTIPWPGDVVPQWGSDRYGRGSDFLESIILAERVPLDYAARLYPNVDFVASIPDYNIRPEGNVDYRVPLGTTQVIKVWWRWKDSKDRVGYSELAIDGTQDGSPKVLYRDDDSIYHDIPVRYSSRFQTPGEPPHKAAGVLDDIVGINTEYNEKLSALADLLDKITFPKMQGKGFTIGNVPRLAPDSNIYPMGFNQELKPIVEQVGNAAFTYETFFSRVENAIFTISGLSRLVMGSMPPGETSGEALQNLLHASISRLETIRTPIQAAWTSLFSEIWVPLIKKYYKDTVIDPVTDQPKKVDFKELFELYEGIDWIWPDVTPRDAIRQAEVAMNLGKGGWLSDETVMRRSQVPSVLDELEKIKQQKQDVILHPTDVRNTAMAKAATASLGQPMEPTQTQDMLQDQTASIQDMNTKLQAAQTPVLSQEDNVRPSPLEQAAQGINPAVPRAKG